MTCTSWPAFFPAGRRLDCPWPCWWSRRRMSCCSTSRPTTLTRLPARRYWARCAPTRAQLSSSVTTRVRLPRSSLSGSCCCLMVSRTTGVRTIWTSSRSPRVAGVSNLEQSNLEQSNLEQSNLVQSQPHPMLRVEQSGPVLTITLDRPERRNAQAPSLWSALAEIGAGLPPTVRVVVIRAAGPSFSAGLDRAMLTPQGAPGEPSVLALAAGAASHLEDVIAQFQRGFAVWAEVPAITIAAVQGHAIGAGFQLALACDLRVVADDVAFAMRETSLGLVPDLAGTSPLVRAVGYARALEICVTGRFVGAQEAVAIGLASVAVPPQDLDGTARDLADAILQAPQAAVRELKPLLRNAIDASPTDQLKAEREAQARLLTAMVATSGK